jgi:hypothetical protein
MKGFELHHILPRSLGGLDVESNLTLLTPKEHFVVHHCLDKTGNNKMHRAFWLMSNTRGFKLSSKEYEILKLNFKTSDEARKNMSIAQKGKKKSVEHIEKIRLSNIGLKRSDETKLKISKLKIGNTNSLGRIVSDETKLKQSIAKLGKSNSESHIKNRVDKINKQYSYNGIIYPSHILAAKAMGISIGSLNYIIKKNKIKGEV